MVIEEIYKEFLASDGVSIDSRTIQPNQLFFALGGSKVDGNDFAKHAIHRGARLAIVEDHKYLNTPHYAVVDSTLDTLQKLAALHRSKLNIPIIGITGSVGKTTTKELLYAVLSTQYKTFCTQGNFNNHIGVPLSILSINKFIEIAVIEMGANHIGEIEMLCTIARPTHGLITKIGKAHLEGFGSLEGVIIAKTELYRFLQKQSGVCFINENDELLYNISRGFNMTKVMIHSEFRSELITSDPCLSILIHSKDGESMIKTNIPGKYNQDNIETAVCVGRYFDIPWSKIVSGIEAYQSKSNRSQLLQDQDNTYIMDAYNANPVSMEAAIKSFAELKTPNNKVLILGEMREMGEESKSEHQKLIDFIQNYHWHQVILVGTQFSSIPQIEGYLYFDEVSVLKAWYGLQTFHHTTFLVKGSRGVALEKMLSPALINPDSVH